MKIALRFAAVLLPLSFTFTPGAFAHGSSVDENIPDAQALALTTNAAERALLEARLFQPF